MTDARTYTKDDPVAACRVSPHRYFYDGRNDPEVPPMTWMEVKAAAPYKPGEVIYVAYDDGYARALIHDLTCVRDGFGDLVEAYVVRRETKAGRWALRTYTVRNGIVQRGYKRAGMAPDVPD